MLTVHIGVGKTATTSFQKVFFPGHRGILYLGKAAEPDGFQAAFRRAVDGLILQDGMVWSPEPLRALAGQALERARTEGRVALYSDEIIIDSDRDKGDTIRRLREAFAPCRILLTIREQRSFLCSLYGHDNNKLKNLPAPCNGRFLPMEDWLGYHRRLLDLHQGWFWLAQYHRLVEALHAAFGPENVLVLPFERFRADRTACLAGLCAFLGVEPDPALDREMGERRLNAQNADRWLQKHLYMHGLQRRGSWLARHPALLRLAGSLYSNRHREARRVRIEIPEEWEAPLCDLFRASNHALAERTGLPLQDLGYAW
ncbi:MAG: hypothetical protein AB7D57_09685 [Desulfovibrionaceae bacterium]